MPGSSDGFAGARGHLGRRHRLRKRKAIAATFKRGRRAYGGHLGVCLAENTCGAEQRAENEAPQHPSRLALAIAKGAGNSPARARLRRLIREAFRTLRDDWPALDIVVSCRKPWPAATLGDVTRELQDLVARARTRRPSRGRR